MTLQFSGGLKFEQSEARPVGFLSSPGFGFTSEVPQIVRVVLMQHGFVGSRFTVVLEY